MPQEKTGHSTFGIQDKDKWNSGLCYALNKSVLYG